MADKLEPITRKENYYSAIINGSETLEPITREEVFLSEIAKKVKEATSSSSSPSGGTSITATPVSYTPGGLEYGGFTADPFDGKQWNVRVKVSASGVVFKQIKLAVLTLTVIDGVASADAGAMEEIATSGESDEHMTLYSAETTGNVIPKPESDVTQYLGGNFSLGVSAEGGIILRQPDKGSESRLENLHNHAVTLVYMTA